MKHMISKNNCFTLYKDPFVTSLLFIGHFFILSILPSHEAGQPGIRAGWVIKSRSRGLMGPYR